jgi:hypothetical protein
VSLVSILNSSLRSKEFLSRPETCGIVFLQRRSKNGKRRLSYVTRYGSKVCLCERFVWHLIWFLVSLQEELKTVAGDIPMSPVTFRRVVCVKGQPHVSRYGSELCVSVGDAWILLFLMCPKRCTYVRIKLRLATISVQIDRSQGRISAGSWRVVCVLKKHAQSTLFH